MPHKLLPMEYPDRFEKRYVSANGGIRWHKQWVNVTSALMGEYVGLEAIDDGLWDVYFGAKKIGRLHERHMRIEDQLGSLRRRAWAVNELDAEWGGYAMSTSPNRGPPAARQGPFV